jgi:signal transduction histidine kinase
MEADLIIAKEKAEENDRLKSAFLANMSHEIRTPLNSIIGFSELLSDPDFQSDDRYNFARIITNSGNNLLAIISDIMDISKIEAGQLEVHKNVFSVNRLIQDIYNEYRIKALDKGIDFQISPCLPSNETLIESDHIKVKQVLVNFVGNALKFTEMGTIKIGIEITGRSVLFMVTDTGIGIAEQYHSRIFERFRQVEGSLTRRYGGNGLGLAISKSLIEMLGGTIGMQSEREKGSRFYFILPDVIV